MTAAGRISRRAGEVIAQAAEAELGVESGISPRSQAAIASSRPSQRVRAPSSIGEPSPAPSGCCAAGSTSAATK